MHKACIVKTIPFLLFVICLLVSKFTQAQQYRFSLQVLDADSSAVPDATIAVNQQKFKTDSTGFLQASLAGGNYIFTITSVNHYAYSFKVVLKRDTVLTARLRQRQSLLGNVTVFSSRNISRTQMSVQGITSTQLRKLPVILGEVDPLKTITLLPGVKNGGEASAGIYVRGGGPDQNLILLDGIPVYNPNHLLGFFSIFNGEAVKNVEVIKGGMPAEYGGRLSSVITIDTKEGNRDSMRGSGGIGLISSRFSLEGPLIKNKSSFIISARRTYIDQIAKAVAKDQIGGNGYFFYDINAKADYSINAANTLQLTFYTGSDDFSFSRDNNGRITTFNTVWGNTLAALTWKQRLSAKMQQQTAVVFNKFYLDSRLGFSSLGFVFASGLTDRQVKTDWQYQPSNWLRLKWGAQYTHHSFTPGAGAVTTGVQEFKSRISSQYAREAALYISTDINLLHRLNVVAGMRYSYFNQVGPNTRLGYDAEGVPTGIDEVYGKGESVALYHYPEPRLAFLYKLRGAASIKASYTRTVQYLHLATTSSATFPSDLWVPSGKIVKPALAEQLALGFFKNFSGNGYEFSAEAYYKTMSNQLEFKPGAQLLLNQNLEGEMIFGSGRAYGVELFFQKRKGRLTGWVGYTLSRAERTYPELNGGKPFVYRYDRLHDLSVVANYPINKKWEASAVFVFGTGNAITLPNGRFTYSLGYNGDNQSVMFTNINLYDKINDYRMPAYHRLDISFTYTPKPDSYKKFKQSWNFGLYNVYNRYNPYFIYLLADEEEGTIQGKKVFLFPIVPSVTWNFSF
ncbi:MAG TPA: TonB-dependent receptor [Ferruginibacter sp.]|nr:TonB-dependent receptor [Ferruginibacter sp.]HMP21625.1 TonB-dependent receptor [Ferruginibacter sp.]